MGLNSLFGPLNVDYCLFFYVMMILSFVIIVINILGLLFLRQNKGIFLMGMFQGFIIYLMHRILYSMCIKSLN
jgi:hypothetical protein